MGESKKSIPLPSPENDEVAQVQTNRIANTKNRRPLLSTPSRTKPKGIPIPIPTSHTEESKPRRPVFNPYYRAGSSIRDRMRSSSASVATKTYQKQKSIGPIEVESDEEPLVRQPTSSFKGKGKEEKPVESALTKQAKTDRWFPSSALERKRRTSSTSSTNEIPDQEPKRQQQNYDVSPFFPSTDDHSIDSSTRRALNSSTSSSSTPLPPPTSTESDEDLIQFEGPSSRKGSSNSSLIIPRRQLSRRRNAASKARTSIRILSEEDETMIEHIDSEPSSKSPASSPPKEIPSNSPFANLEDDHILLSYPLQGSGTITVTAKDAKRLEMGEFLNDTLIDFYLKWLSNTSKDSSTMLQTHVFNSFFYTRLTQNIKKGSDPYDNVKKWTSKINLFEKKYAIVPIHEDWHWYLIIICNLDHCIPRDKAKTDTVSEDELKNSKLHDTSSDMDSANGEDEKPLVHRNKQRARNRYLSDTDDTDGEDEVDSRELAEKSPIKELVSNENAKKTQKPLLVDESDRPGYLYQLPTDKRSSSRPRLTARSMFNRKNVFNTDTHSDEEPIDTEMPYMFLLDSLGGSTQQIARKGKFSITPCRRQRKCFNALKKYLESEARERLGVDLANFVMPEYVIAKVPGQDNSCDCGVFVLHYVECFLSDPERYVRVLLSNGEQTDEAWEDARIPSKRMEIKSLISKLQEEQGKTTAADTA